MKNSTYKDLLIIFATAFLLRLLFLFQFQSVILFDNNIVDMAYHHDWAKAIADGIEYYSGPFFRAPLYPIFLGIVYTVFGDNPLIIKIIQAIIGSFSALLVYLTTLNIFTKRTALIAGLIFAVYGPVIFFDAQLLIPNLAIFLNLSALYFITKIESENKILHFIFAGFFLGLSAIARPTILLFVLFLFIYWIIQNRKNIKSYLFCALFVLIPILPVTVYNYMQNSQFTLIAAYGGINFYIGNNKNADGVSPVIPGIRQDWKGGQEDTKRLAEKDVGHPLTESELSDYWFNRAVNDITDDPMHFIKLLIKKMVLLLNGFELSNNFDFYFFAHQTSLMQLLIWRNVIFFPFGLLLPLAVIGIFLAGKENKSKSVLLYILATSISIILFLVTARYRLYLIAPLAMFASFALTKVISEWRQFSFNKRLIILSVFIIFFFTSQRDPYGYEKTSDAHGLHATGSIYLKNGEISKASDFFIKALNADSNQTETLNDYGLLLASQHRYDDAIKLLKRGASLPYTNYTLRYNLGYVYIQANQPENAIAPFKSVIAEVPDFSYAYNNLGLAYMWTDKLDSALEVFRTLRSVNPQFANGYYNSALIWLDKQNLDSAKFCFGKFLEFGSSDMAEYKTAEHLLDSLNRL